MGEWIDPSVRRAPPPDTGSNPADLLSSWATSSYDLLNGIQVTEIPETEPGELFAELSELQPEFPKRSGA